MEYISKIYEGGRIIIPREIVRDFPSLESPGFIIGELIRGKYPRVELGLNGEFELYMDKKRNMILPEDIIKVLKLEDRVRIVGPNELDEIVQIWDPVIYDRYSTYMAKYGDKNKLLVPGQSYFSE